MNFPSGRESMPIDSKSQRVRNLILSDESDEHFNVQSMLSNETCSMGHVGITD